MSDDHKQRFDDLLMKAGRGNTGTVTVANAPGTGNVIVAGKAPNKEVGWCDAQGVEHAWQVQDYTLTVDPPLAVRICQNCGARQTRPTRAPEPEWK